MNLTCISEFQNDFLKITNQKILSFYQSNSHIDFETVNLSLIDILKTTENPGRNQDSISEDDSLFVQARSHQTILYQEQQKIKELDVFITNLREAIRKLIQSISSKYIIVKSEYIRNIKSESSEKDARDLFANTNKHFFESVCSLLSGVIRTRFSNVADKTKIILHQFNKILTANTDQIFVKPDMASSKIEEFLTNFESNSAHMIQAIVHLLSDCLAQYESRVKQATESIKKHDDPAFTAYYKLLYELNDILHQLPNSSDESENAGSFENLLSNTFPTASISRGSESESNEYLLLREHKPTIYIETHDIHDRNIGISEVKLFIKRAIEKNTNSIIVSQYTGITSKPNYHIEIHNNIVVIYLHKLSYSADTLQIATDMIDAISNKLTDFCSLSENKYSIPKDILDNVNREYQNFILQKELIISGFKEQQKLLLSKLDDIRFSALDQYLSTRYSSCKKQGYNCDMCNNFNVGTLKGLAAHKRGCARKLAGTVQHVERDYYHHKDETSFDESIFKQKETLTV